MIKEALLGRTIIGVEQKHDELTLQLDNLYTVHVYGDSLSYANCPDFEIGCSYWFDDQRYVWDGKFMVLNVTVTDASAWRRVQ